MSLALRAIANAIQGRAALYWAPLVILPSTLLHETKLSVKIFEELEAARYDVLPKTHLVLLATTAFKYVHSAKVCRAY